MRAENLMEHITSPIVSHPALNTVFFGNRHAASWTTEDDNNSISIWQFRGINYGNISARFMQAELNEKFEEMTECYHHGYRHIFPDDELCF